MTQSQVVMMMMTKKKTLIALALLGAACAHADVPPANRANLSAALRDFLAQRGDLCLAKYDWPIDVSARDVAKRTRDSIQLPVMERQGLVRSRDGIVVYRTDGQEEPVPTKRYELTALGRKAYKTREIVSHPRGGEEVVHHGDLCAGRLELDMIAKITEPQAAPGQAPTASAEYLYRFTPEPWVRNAEIRAVFPMVDAILQGQGRMPMTQHFHFDGQRWVADAKLD